MTVNKIVLSECAARTLLMILHNGKAYTSGLQNDAVKLLHASELINYDHDFFGEFVVLAPGAHKTLVALLTRQPLLGAAGQ